MINKIQLRDFRNFEKKDFEFSDNITVISGHNGVGKTNILEAIFLLSTGRSFKARVEGEMIAYGESITSVTGITGNTRLEIKITTGENGWPKKRLLVNNVPKRQIDFAGNLRTVLFGPWDMDLVTDSPSLRRKFLDTVLSQIDREYRRSILSYEKGIRMRNKLLFRIREEGISRSQLLFWNQLLIKNGNYITQKREEFVDFTNNTSEDNKAIKSNYYKLEYDRSTISEGRLEQYAREEVAAATTLVGPHRDDFIFKMLNDKKTNDKFGNMALSAFGSRGQQRMGVLWLKMKELDYIEDVLKRSDPLHKGSDLDQRPTLLLDDIFSELDHEHRKIVMELATRQQTIITTADEHFLEGFEEKRNKVIKI